MGDRSGEGTAYGNLGNAHRSRGDFKTAVDYNERYLKITKELGDRSGEGNAYCNLALTYYILGYSKTAIDYSKRHLKIAKELGEKSGEGTAYGCLGVAHDSLGDFKTAIHYHERHLNIAKELGDRWGEGTAYGNLGNAHHSLGDSETAIDYNEQHLKIAKELGDRSGEAVAYGSFGSAYRSRSDFRTAIDYNERYLKISKELGDRSGEGKAYCNLGKAYYELGEINTAIDYSNRHLEIAKELGEKSGDGAAYGSLGIGHERLGDFKTAIHYHERHLNIAKDLGDRSGEGEAYGDLGNAHCRQGDFKTALDYNERHLNIAKELGSKSGEGRAYGNLGITHHYLGDFKTAIHYHERVLKLVKELGDTFGEGIAYLNLGGSLESLGQVPSALRYYRLSVASFNNVRDRLQLKDECKVSLRDRYQAVYAALWRLMLAEGNVEEALFSVEQGRAQGLKDLIELNYAFERSDGRTGKDDGTVTELLSYLPPVTIFMAFGRNELVFWVCQRGKYVELRKKRIHSPDKVNTFFQALLQAVKQETGARDRLKCEDRTLELPRGESLVLKRSPQDSTRTKHLDLQKGALSTLYDLIIEPIQDLFLGDELIFIPEGPLCLAPFAAFEDPNSKYLCESFRIRVAPSLTSLKMIADCPVDYHHKSGALLVGDPLTELPPLPCAREEVEMIGRMLGITPLIAEKATKNEVLRTLSSVALVHIAAHGDMKTGEIALASTEGMKKDIFTMRDVLGVQMRPRLVVLSCCQSANGEIKAEGVVGIARAFLGAGARSVLVSLWAIDDQATLEFMKKFYYHLAEGQTASESLNQTMNCMRESEEFGAVKFWAPFVLIGDDVTLEFSESK